MGASRKHGGTMRKIDLPAETARIEEFIRSYLNQAGFSKLVLGLSGGVDSAVCAGLAVRAIGKENVMALMMPYRKSNPNSLIDAETWAKQLGIEHRVIDISGLTDSYFDKYEPDASQLRRGNWMARARMNVLFDHSAKLKALVLGTSNRTELLVGYFTQFGDSACALEPIGHLYKSEVWGLARLLGVPQEIMDKKPSADLWEGQSDEDEMGIDYCTLDEILYELMDLDLSFEGSDTLTHPREIYQKVDRMVRSSAFKRSLPPIPGE